MDTPYRGAGGTTPHLDASLWRTSQDATTLHQLSAWYSQDVNIGFAMVVTSSNLPFPTAMFPWHPTQPSP